MNYKEARLLGFHFRRSKSGDRIGIKSVITIKDKAGTHKAERLNFEELYNPICIFHRHTSPFRHERPKIYVSSCDLSIEENWHTNRIYQAALREAKDRAAAYFRGRGCWNPAKNDLEEEVRSFMCGIYLEIHGETDF